MLLPAATHDLLTLLYSLQQRAACGDDLPAPYTYLTLLRLLDGWTVVLTAGSDTTFGWLLPITDRLLVTCPRYAVNLPPRAAFQQRGWLFLITTLLTLSAVCRMPAQRAQQRAAQRRPARG